MSVSGPVRTWTTLISSRWPQPYAKGATSQRDEASREAAVAAAVGAVSVLPQDSGFPSASTLPLPLFCTTRASAHSPPCRHHSGTRRDGHAQTEKREPTRAEETQNRERENHEGETNMEEEIKKNEWTNRQLNKKKTKEVGGEVQSLLTKLLFLLCSIDLIRQRYDVKFEQTWYSRQ